MFYKSLLKPLLFQVDAEKAHHTAHKVARRAAQSKLASRIIQSVYDYQSPLLEQTFWGHTFRNPVGLAAGFDKNGCLVEAMELLGMGFVEVGSITAQARSGNPKPRAFRLPRDQALINRMGLNNDGAQTVVKRLQNSDYTIPLGLNIAKTHDPGIMGADALDDYLFSYKQARKIADYITVNISCPNTAEGKTFEEPEVLDRLLTTLLNSSELETVPTLVKFSSDITPDTLRALVDICEAHGVEGYVACNTSSSRRNLKTDPERLEAIGAGGLSGAPLAAKSLRVVRWLREMVDERKLIIGVGGIRTFDSALAMLQAGANLLQIYTGLIYEGPGLVRQINRGLANHMRAQGLQSLKEL